MNFWKNWFASLTGERSEPKKNWRILLLFHQNQAIFLVFWLFLWGPGVSWPGETKNQTLGLDLGIVANGGSAAALATPVETQTARGRDERVTQSVVGPHA